MKPDKGKSVIILDGKLYDSVLGDIISDISEFENLNEYPTLKGEAPLQHFLLQLKL